MDQELKWVREIFIRERGYKALGLEELRLDMCVVYLDRNEYGKYAPGWAVVKKTHPGGRVLIDPYMSGEMKTLSINRLMQGEWVHDMPRRLATPCKICGHSNHDDSECNCSVKRGAKMSECLCEHDTRLEESKVL